MAQAGKIEEALGRFETALRQLEAGMVRWHEQDSMLDRLRGECEALRQDRVRLSRELEEVRTRASELAAASREAAGHVGSAMTRIRGVLGE
jgi:hypothetical protein